MQIRIAEQVGNILDKELTIYKSHRKLGNTESAMESPNEE